MANIMDVISVETNGQRYKTFKRNFDAEDISMNQYDDSTKITWKRCGEYPKQNSVIDVKPWADLISHDKPIFTYFLDGSRRVFKVDDISYNNQVFPVMAGQIGIGCCKRTKGILSKFKFHDERVISLPTMAFAEHDWDRDIFKVELLKKINSHSKFGLKFTDILVYSKAEGEKLENRGISVIQDMMVDKEKQMVAELISERRLNASNYLLKDGSLEYRLFKEDDKRKMLISADGYRWVVGASKSFNAEKCVDVHNTNNSSIIASLPVYHRTPVCMYQSEFFDGVQFAIWYVRIRDRKHTLNALDGILKLERILITDDEKTKGLNTEDVNIITANIINESNPVCYGADKRWANHLYPIYLTETFVKSKYLSNEVFLNLF